MMSWFLRQSRVPYLQVNMHDVVVNDVERSCSISRNGRSLSVTVKLLIGRTHYRPLAERRGCGQKSVSPALAFNAEHRRPGRPRI